MKKKLFLLAFSAVFTACQHEIDFDYHEVEPLLMIEARLTNEGTDVLLTMTRSVNDSVKGRGLAGADIVVSCDGVGERVPFNASTGHYQSAFCGTPGKTYQLSISYNGHHYEAQSTMMPPALIQSAEFLWQPVLNERLLAYEIWATDPEPSERNYFLYRMDRMSTHPHFEDKAMTDAYRWSVFDDRGCPPGLIYRDIMCMSDRTAEEDEEENWERILYEGDHITLSLMTLDKPAYEFFRSLRAGQSQGANPRSNIAGSPCLGYFAAASIVRTDTIVFCFEGIPEQ